MNKSPACSIKHPETGERGKCVDAESIDTKHVW